MVERKRQHAGQSGIPAPRGAGILLLIALFVLVTLGAAIPAGHAYAADEMPKLGIQPANSDETFFSEKLKPGKSKTLSVELKNVGAKDVEILTYAADVYPLINGGLGVKLSDEDATGTTTWLDYETQTFDLPHGQGQVVEFTVTVPKETEPGEYLTSLVIQNAKPIEGTGGVAMNQILRQAIAVSITVPGDLKPGLEIGTVTYRDNPLVDSVLIEVRNTGNAHLKPGGQVTIKNASGDALIDVPVQMDSVYAGMSTSIEIGLPEPFESGDYTATVDLADPDRGGEASATDVPFTVVNTEQASTDVRIDSFDVQPIRASDDAPVQFANVTVSVQNPGERIDNGQVVLHVERDGELVEDYPLSIPGPIAVGATDVQQRYLPLTGWQPGVYTFSVRVESVDPASGEATVIVESAEPVTIEIK